MYKHHYETVKLESGNMHLKIEFENDKLKILSTFLETEVSAFSNWIKEYFDKVLCKKSEKVEFSCNICGIEVYPTKTYIYDNITDEELLGRCEVDTKELRQLIDEWCETEKRFKETGSI